MLIRFHLSKMMQVPWLDKVLYKNRIADTFRPTAGTSIMKLVAEAIRERQALVNDDIGDVKKSEGKKDFLNRYIEIQQRNPEIPPW